MAETAIFAVLKILGDALASELVSRAFSQLSRIMGCSSNLEASMNYINSELRLMQNLIESTDKHDQSNLNQNFWINEVRKLAYGIENSVAEFVYYAEFYPRSSHLKRVGSQILKAEKNLKRFAEMRELWVPTTNNAQISRNSSLSNEHSHHDIINASAHFISEENIVGIKENRAMLTNWLNSEEQLSIFSVWGMGGVGKTTLVTHIYNKEKKHFNYHAWITVSQSYTVENILQNLISELCKNGQTDPIDITNKNIRELKEYAINLLEDRKYLIVLDDMWNPTAFQDIRDVFIDNKKGSRIMITSRDLHVAFLAPENNRLELKPLLGQESRDLFYRKAFPFETNHKCPANLMKWASEIVAKCGGLPLALVSLGNMLSLSEKTEIEWKRVNDQLTWELDNNPNLDHLKKILNLSFKYLPRYLKNCFLYCSLFPEDFLLRRKSLMRLWVAEGFIEEKGRSTLEEVAEGYLKELIYRNMLQVVQRNYFGRVKRCRMHDTLRELAISLCAKENFGKLHENKKPVNVSTFARRISIVEQREEISNDASLPQLKSFMYFDHTLPSSSWLSMIFKKSRYIIVLNLEGLQIKSIPNAIGELFNLHYLCLRQTKVKFLPKSIKKLHNLQTMDLALSKIEKLPNGIVELKKLRHLIGDINIDPIYRPSQAGIHLSKGMFYMKDLQTLQGVEANDMVVRKLGNLTQLRSFRIWNVKENHIAGLCLSLSKLRFLSSLSINALHENVTLQLDDLHLPQIQKLVLYGRLKENTLESLLLRISVDGIKTLRLGWSQQQNDPLSSLSCCKNLTYLNLRSVYEGHQLTFKSGWFLKLKCLILQQMSNLVQVVTDIFYI
jgi:disease resistance protein RPM1